MFYDLLAQAMARQEGRGIRLLGISVGLADSILAVPEIPNAQTQLDLAL